MIGKLAVAGALVLTGWCTGRFVQVVKDEERELHKRMQERHLADISMRDLPRRSLRPTRPDGPNLKLVPAS